MLIYISNLKLKFFILCWKNEKKVQLNSNFMYKKWMYCFVYRHRVCCVLLLSFTSFITILFYLILIIHRCWFKANDLCVSWRLKIDIQNISAHECSIMILLRIRVAVNIFKDFDNFRTALPVKERFFLLNDLCMSMLRSIDIHKTFGFNRHGQCPLCKFFKTSHPPL